MWRDGARAGLSWFGLDTVGRAKRALSRAPSRLICEPGSWHLPNLACSQCQHAIPTEFDPRHIPTFPSALQGHHSPTRSLAHPRPPSTLALASIRPSAHPLTDAHTHPHTHTRSHAWGQQTPVSLLTRPDRRWPTRAHAGAPLAARARNKAKARYEVTAKTCSGTPPSAAAVTQSASARPSPRTWPQGDCKKPWPARFPPLCLLNETRNCKQAMGEQPAQTLHGQRWLVDGVFRTGHPLTIRTYRMHSFHRPRSHREGRSCNRF